MVAAIVSHCRILVTKFHQNRPMLTGRSAVHRHTDRQTNSGKNKGPSGFSQIGPPDRQTDRGENGNLRPSSMAEVNNLNWPQVDSDQVAQTSQG